jgi:hypothetical protein
MGVTAARGTPHTQITDLGVTASYNCYCVSTTIKNETVFKETLSPD